MMRYIALLRGINVGGHQVKMADLRRLFADLGFADVGSYIQTGNVFFDSDEADRAALRSRIEGHLRTALGYEVATCLRTVEEFAAVLALDPFAGIELRPDMRFSVSFLAEPVVVEPTLPYTTPKGDFALVRMTPQELFVVWYLVGGRPGSGFGPLEKRYKVPATTRFWHTAAKILAAAKPSE
jgi:uncharacterized protein (DUF1697 family)